MLRAKKDDCFPSNDRNRSELEKQIELFKAGDRAAFVAVVQATQGRLFRFCHRLTGSELRAEELAQECYMKLVENIETIRADTVISWLFTVARNRFIDATRSSEAKLERLRLQTAPFEEDSGSDSCFREDASQSDLELRASVRQALSRLDPDDRLVILLMDFEGQTAAEASEVLGISETAARSRIRRARELFLGILDGIGQKNDGMS